MCGTLSGQSALWWMLLVLHTRIKEKDVKSQCKILKMCEVSGCVETHQPANTTSALWFLLCRQRRANQERLRFHTADKKAPQGGAEELSTLQMQRQDKNVSALVASISKLQQEKQQLQKEKDELLARMSATNGGNGRNQQTPGF